MWHRLKILWRNLTHKPIVEDDLTEEIESYEAMLADEKSRTGMDRSTAVRAARLADASWQYFTRARHHSNRR
jgi:hypothetical protein